MKKIFLSVFCILFSVFCISASASAGTLLNYPYLYRGMRSLGMGGTGIAVSGTPEALFHNPASLYDMGFQIGVINPLIEADTDAMDIVKDLMDAMDLETETQRTDKLVEIIEDNKGKALHARASLFPHVGFKNIAGGFLGQARIDARLHEPLGSAGAVEMSGGYEYGPVAGASFPIPITGLRVGAGGKWIARSWIEHGFTIREMAAEDFDISDYQKDGSDFSLDLGILYELPFLEGLKPKVGISYLDITDLDFGDSKIPARLNLGFSINPKVPVLADLIVALDYEDLTHSYSQDSSFWKRLHLGMEGGFLKRHILLRLGLNQGYPTAGVELDVWLLRLGYVYYSEEMGAYAGQDRDSRHLVQLTLGW